MAIIEDLEVGGTAKGIGPLRTAFPDGHPLAGVRVKLERARSHLATLNDEVAAFLAREPYELVEERLRDGKEIVVRVRVHEATPLAWSGVVGDCLQNMRSALEYLAWELARLNLGREPPRDTSFPIYLKPDDFFANDKNGEWRRGSGAYKVRNMAPHARELVEEAQPYRRPRGLSPGVVPREVIEGGWESVWRLDELWILNELARYDRHRALRVVGAASDSIGGSGSALASPEESVVRFGPFEDGGLVARYVFAEPNADYRVTGLGVTLQLEDEANPRGWSVVLTLGRILDRLDGEIVPRFERFF